MPLTEPHDAPTPTTTTGDRPTVPPHELRLDLATLCLSGLLEDKLTAAAAAGFHGVEIFEDDLVGSSWSPREIRERCADLGLALDLYQPFRDVEAAPPEEFDATLRRAERKFDVMEALGVDTMLVCSSVSPTAVDDDDLAAEQLHALAERAADRGLRLAYEALAWGRFVNTYDHAWRIVRHADHPALGLCLDSFHVYARGSDPSGIGAIPAAALFFLQLADAPRLRMDLRDWSRHHRVLPGQGSFDLAAFVGHVMAAGYDGPLSLEIFNDVVRQADPRRAAVDAMRSLLALHGRRVPGQEPVADPREQVRVAAEVPPAPRLTGHVFTELAVDARSGPAVARTLRALGFVHVGQHRSKPVALWQQGDARVLLNSAPRGPAGSDPAGAVVSALGVASADPVASARRAESLLAPVLPRVRGEHEADLASVAAPDGTTVFFLRAGEDPWLADFLPTGAAPAAEGALVRTDHVSLTAPFDDFDRVALFYRLVLGLRLDPPTEFTAPFGLVRTREAADPERHVRIALNAALVRRGGWAPAVPRPQHVAFATDDAIGCARRLRAAGAPLLDIPANYYDDLDARLAPPPELLAALRANSVLYDRDGDAEFLHFYTDLLGSRVFFEVVQRIGGYPGYGAANAAPVRMAAHRRRRLAGPRTHDYSLAHLTCLDLPAPQLVDAAADAGYRYVGLRLTRVTPEEPHHPLTTDRELMRRTRARLAATGVEVHDVELVRMGPDDEPRDFLPVLAAGVELGARHVIAQLPDPDHARKVERFADLCDLAAPLGLTVNLEFVSWTDTPDLADAARVLRAADRGNAGILVDLLHFDRSGSSVAQLRSLPREWFHFAHVCDAPAVAPSTVDGRIREARAERLVPGEGGIDTRGILAAMPAGIAYALEIPHAGRTAEEGAPGYARAALTATRSCLDGPGGTAGRSGGLAGTTAAVAS